MLHKYLNVKYFQVMFFFRKNFMPLHVCDVKGVKSPREFSSSFHNYNYKVSGTLLKKPQIVTCPA